MNVNTLEFGWPSAITNSSDSPYCELGVWFIFDNEHLSLSLFLSLSLSLTLSLE